MTERHVQRNTVDFPRHSGGDVRWDMLNANGVTQEIDQVRVVPILPPSDPIREPHASTIEHNQVAVSREANAQPPLATVECQGLAPVWEVLPFSRSSLSPGEPNKVNQ